jgi:hypothetical protein
VIGITNLEAKKYFKMKNRKSSQVSVPVKMLQKVTNATLKKILELPIIHRKDIEHLSPELKKQLANHITQQLNSLQGKDWENFREKVEPICNETVRNQLWEYNHNTITRTIHNYILENNRTPSANEISIETGISRQCIHRHLKEFSTHPMYIERYEQFKTMGGRVLSAMYQMAITGDTKAAKIFLQATGHIKQHKEQNNYIQINNLKVSEDTIRQLPPAKILQIEKLISKHTKLITPISENGNKQI